MKRTPIAPPAVRRILHLRTVSGKGGGPEKTLLATPQHIGAGYDVRLAYIRPSRDPEYDMPERARALGVSLIDIPESGPVDPRSVWKLTREVRRFQPHVLHAHDYKTDILSIPLGKWFGIPVVTTLHGYVTRGGRLELYYLLNRWALRRMRHLVAVSPDLYEYLDELGIPENRRTLVENGIDTELFQRRPRKQLDKSRCGCKPERPMVGAVGRLQPEKGFDLLIQAAASLFQQGFDFELVIAGEGPERGKLEALIRERGVGERVRLLGHCSQPMELYQAMDVFVLSSLREGLPNVLLEAMAMEVPVVATRVAGVPRVIEHDINGLLVPTGDVRELAAALGKLLPDGPLQSQLAAAARKTIVERYTFARRMEKIRRIYDRVLGTYVDSKNYSKTTGGN